jgi:uncharacterized protein (TIGR04255 family)
MERTSSFILDQGALSFLTTEYDVFETFISTFLNGLRAVQDAVELSYTDRIGVRYLDAIFPKSGETLSEYLSGSMLGLTEKLHDSVVHTFCETLFKADNINVRSRVVIQDGGVGFPPDLQPLILSLPDRFSELRGRHAIMDTDGWLETREPFGLDQIHGHLIRIHTAIEKAFHASITENALKVWGAGT